MLMLGLALLLATAADVPRGVPTDDACVALDERGEPYPICFDPGDGFVVGTRMRLSRSVMTQAVRTGVHLRSGRSSRSKGSPWFNNHRLLGLEAWDGEQRGLTFTAYDGTLRRHLEEGFILVPTARPARIPFPFDVTVALRLGHLERRVWEGPGWTLEAGRLGLLLDPVRAETERAWFGVGPAAGHSVRRSREGASHTVAPFTELMFDAGLESRDGLWALRASGLAGWSVGIERGLYFRARTDVGLERVVLAVADQPVVLQVSGAYVHRDAGLARRSEWTANAGLAVRVFGAR
ncbi:hypothetical protein HV824_25320 [Myxococcus sp. AM009]|uniref:hypothetical protein n=1 Tax=Myxococcus sp. AM009 TaxID=2745137 RepID=UPI001594F646|nr:hypothetical protein [Myxococcus sp. AM009]NVJ01412.1 hypothetical protein [Myxococcus sp. AM009]